jgi:hypothetical protein
MSSNNVFVESGRRGGKKGGKARNQKKRKACLLNLKKANDGKLIAAKVREVEGKLIHNREQWMLAGKEGRTVLDKVFNNLLLRKNRLTGKMKNTHVEKV